MWRRVAVDALERLAPPGRARRRCSSGRRPGSPAIWPCRSPTSPSGCVWTTQWADSLKATTPSSSRSVMRRRGPQDRLLADVDLPDAADAARRRAAVERVAVAGVHRAGLVDDDDERDVRLLLAVADAHVDRQRLLERRLLVAAGAVAVRPADHHEALAEVADVDLERGQLAVGEADARHVDEDDAVVGGEAGEVGRERLGDDRVDLLALRLERRDQLGWRPSRRRRGRASAARP